jgi:hypothetical protein
MAQLLIPGVKVRVYPRAIHSSETMHVITRDCAIVDRTLLCTDVYKYYRSIDGTEIVMVHMHQIHARCTQNKWLPFLQSWC